MRRRTDNDYAYTRVADQVRLGNKIILKNIFSFFFGINLQYVIARSKCGDALIFVRRDGLATRRTIFLLGSVHVHTTIFKNGSTRTHFRTSMLNLCWSGDWPENYRCVIPTPVQYCILRLYTIRETSWTRTRKRCRKRVADKGETSRKTNMQRARWKTIEYACNVVVMHWILTK